MKLTKYICCFFLFASGLFFASCTKEDYYKEFMKGGEIAYAGRVDSVVVHSGNKRIQLSLFLGNDPLVTKVKAFWNDKRDSVEAVVKPEHIKNQLDLIIPNLAEGNYNFVIYTYDKKNNPSVIYNASGEVFGASYHESVVNRRLESMQYSSTDTRLKMNWVSANLGDIGTEVNYTGQDGTSKKVIVPAKDAVSYLEDYKEGSTLTYKTLYKPNPLSIDVFSKDYASAIIPFFERQMDKAGFKLLVLPTDATTAHGWLMPNMWDNKYGIPGFATINRMPQWFTFDMGSAASINRFKAWQAPDRLYAQQNLRKFEIWGSNNPNPDGSWTSWTRLADCESVKPSGLPLGQNSGADIAYANAGEEFLLPSGSPKVRYIRIKVLETWGVDVFATIAELTFFTRDR
jgi:hypothetical protein